MAENTTTLDQLDTGQSATIKKVGGNGQIRQRLMDMGVTNGAAIDVVKRSPLGDPVEYRVRGYKLSLRNSEAKLIEVSL